MRRTTQEGEDNTMLCSVHDERVSDGEAPERADEVVDARHRRHIAWNQLVEHPKEARAGRPARQSCCCIRCSGCCIRLR
jgi:hypothetical protein